jgi:hypothetical protein
MQQGFLFFNVSFLSLAIVSLASNLQEDEIKRVFHQFKFYMFVDHIQVILVGGYKNPHTHFYRLI